MEVSMYESLPDNISVVYKIETAINGLIYIGSAHRYRTRIRYHILALRSGSHPNPHLQNAYIKYGENAFSVAVVEECASETLLQREQFYLDTLYPWKRGIGYNISKDAIAPMKGIKHTEEARKKLSVSSARHRHSAETKALISASAKGNKRCLGRVLSDVTKRKIADALEGRKRWSEEDKKKMSINRKGKKKPPGFRVGSKHSKETRDKISKANKEHIVSEETRLKISKSHMGTKSSEETRKKISESLKGNHRRWGQ
jgi:group I intron endonuclease